MAWSVGDYATAEDVRADLKTTSTNDDGLIEQIIGQASREIDLYCGRRFYAVGEMRRFHALDDVSGPTLFVDEDLTYVSEVTLDDGSTVLSPSDYVLLPSNFTPKYAIYIKNTSTNWWGNYTNDPVQAIAVTGSWGYSTGSTPPPPVRRACMALTRYRYEQRRAPFETAGMGEPSETTVPSGMPQYIKDMLASYVRPRVGGV